MDKLDRLHRGIQRGAPALGAWPDINFIDLINARNLFGWSQDDMALMLGYSRRHYIRIEKHEIPVPRAVAWAVGGWVDGYRRL